MGEKSNTRWERGTIRRLRSRWSAPSALAAALCLVVVISAPTASAAPRDLEARVSLEGSNGFSVTVTGGAYSGFRTATIRARRGSRRTNYGTLREVTLGRRLFAADFGPRGSFDLRFEPRDARMLDGAPRCGEGRARVVSGVFNGRIEIQGEHDFMTVERTRAPGTMTRSGLGYCRRSRPIERPRHPERRVSLSGCRLDGPRAMSGLIALSDRPAGPRSVTWAAIRLERAAGLFVSRYVSLRAPSTTLRSAPGDFSTAELTPPSPFGGGAVYSFSEDEEGNDAGELVGDLTAGFAGSGGPVALTPTDYADFGPRRTGLLDCAFGLAPASERRAAVKPSPSLESLLRHRP